MNVQVQEIVPIRVVMLRHTGAYEALDAQFDRLWSWVEGHHVEPGRTIGIYWDNPDVIPTKDLRSAACVEVPPSFALSNTAGLPLELGWIEGGEYAATRHVGPYDGLDRAWGEMTEQVEGPMGRRVPDDKPAFEVYVNDPSETPAQKLITELYLPLR